MRRSRPVLLIALTVAAVLIVALARQKQSLEARYRELAAQRDDPYVGMYVPAVPAASVDGDSVIIGEPAEGEKEVLLVFDTRCPYCRASVPWWNAVADSLAGNSHVRVCGVSLDSLEATWAYAIEHQLGFPVLSLTEPRAHAVFHLRQVPQVLILAEEGRVVFTRLGAVKGDPVVDSIVVAARAPAFQQPE